MNGLCRVRSCRGPQGELHIYAMCDECEALWLVPNTDGPSSFPDATHPQCPICQQALYGPQAHWAHAEELQNTDWQDNAIYELPSGAPADAGTGNSTEDDAAIDLADTVDFPAKDLSYGKDDPKPGC